MRTCFLRQLFEPSSDMDRLLGDSTSASIVEAAVEAITVHGWQKLTMSDIAKKAGVGRATLYRYFPSKDVLQAAVTQCELRRFLVGMTAARGGPDDTTEALVASTTFLLEFLATNRLLERLRETDRSSLLATLADPDLISTAAEFSAQLWRTQIHGDTEIDEVQMRHLRTVSEITTRLTLSLIAVPDTMTELHTPGGAERFAVTYMVPLLTGAGPAR